MISIATIFEWLFLGLAFLSLWIRNDFRIWGSFLGLSLLSGLIGTTLLWSGLFVALVWAILWFIYAKNKKPILQFSLFLILIILSFGFIFHLFPGFIPTRITPNFQIGLATPMMGIFPLALMIPLAMNSTDWKKVLKGVLLGCLGREIH